MSFELNVAKQLDEVHLKMTEGFRDGNAGIIVNEFYTPDAWVVGPEDATFRGSDALTELYSSIVGKYTWSMKRESLMMLSPDSAIEFIIGAIEPVSEGETLIYKIQLSWKITRTHWKCAAQFFAYGTNFNG